jgi:signal transduction histidine kinase
MFIKIALVVSVLLQFATAFIAISLIRRKNVNIAWVLISIGFLLMAIRRVIELQSVYGINPEGLNSLFSTWVGIITSLIMMLSLIFIRRIFNIQKRYEELRQQSESNVLSAIIRTEENERQRFAKELHDGLGPLLASVKLSVSALSSQERPNPEILQNTDKLIDESIATIKEISNNLSPHVLNNFGLLKAVRTFVSKLPKEGVPHIGINSNLDEKRYRYNIEVVFYRVICELITNTIKHAKAQRLSIDLYEEDNLLTLVYRDNGCGFDYHKVQTEKHGMGLSNVVSRIKSLKGECLISSKIGKGTTIKIKVKFN